MEEDRQLYLQQLETVFSAPFEASNSRPDLATVKELKKRYERTGAEFFHENSKYMGRRGKDDQDSAADGGISGGENVSGGGAVGVAAARRAYHGATLDLAGRLNESMRQKEVALMESLLGLVQIQDDLHQRQHTACLGLTDYLQRVHAWSVRKRVEVEAIVRDGGDRKKRILAKHADWYNPLTIEKGLDSTGEPMLEKSGYLYKRSSHTVVRPVWARRFFCLRANNTLEYYTQDERRAGGETVAIDLRLCLVRPCDSASGERRFTFEILSPAKTYVLQAESERDMAGWVEALQRAAQRALQDGSGRNAEEHSQHVRRELGLTSSVQYDEREAALGALLAENQLDTSALSPASLEHLWDEDSNRICADCRTPHPEWASITHGILICIACSGIHRSLGVQKSKVRSLLLDYWEPEQREILGKIGNRRSWEIFEADLTGGKDQGLGRAGPESGQVEREEWIRAKYDLLLFIRRESVDIKAALESGDLPGCLRWILVNREMMDQVLQLQDGLKCTALQYAIEQNNWPAASLLMTWSASPSVRDSRGHTALHYMAGNPAFSLPVLLAILRRIGNADLESTFLCSGSEKGVDVWGVAEEAGNLKFTTLLRLLLQSDDQEKTRTSAVPDPSGHAHSPDASEASTRPGTPETPKSSSGSGVRHSLARLFTSSGTGTGTGTGAYPHFQRHIRTLLQQQYNYYYHERGSRKASHAPAVKRDGGGSGGASETEGGGTDGGDAVHDLKATTSPRE